jgi:aldehyde dehydrogenase (NAD+)
MPGVINILYGNKHHLTKYLTEHQQVNAIWYMADGSNKDDLTAIQFIKYSSNFNLKQNWFINMNQFKNLQGKDYEKFLERDYSFELKRHSIQYKYISIPMGVIFAN